MMVRRKMSWKVRRSKWEQLNTRRCWSMAGDLFPRELWIVYNDDSTKELTLELCVCIIWFTLLLLLRVRGHCKDGRQLCNGRGDGRNFARCPVATIQQLVATFLLLVHQLCNRAGPSAQIALAILWLAVILAKGQRDAGRPVAGACGGQTGCAGGRQSAGSNRRGRLHHQGQDILAVWLWRNGRWDQWRAVVQLGAKGWLSVLNKSLK